jgi:hypothetical protein
MSVRSDHTLKYLAPKRYVPRDYKDNRVGDTALGASVLARIVMARLKESERLKRYLVVVDIDGGCYVLCEGSRVREFVDLHQELVVGVYDRTVDVGDLTGDLKDFLREAA